MMNPYLKITATAIIVCSHAGAVTLQGTGSSFAGPLIQRWANLRAVGSKNKIDYKPSGSSVGIHQIQSKAVDFAATDVFMSSKELAAAGRPLVHLPITMGAVAVIYRVPGIQSGLKLTPQLVAGLFSGSIKSWKDPALSQANPGVDFPDLPVEVVHRGDGSGTTAIFTDYLTKVSSSWAKQIGMGATVDWPIGTAAKGNSGVADRVASKDGTVGYSELVFAQVNHLSYASLQNASGNFVEPSIDSTIAAAASGIRALPEDFRSSLTNAPGEASYPAVGFTWIIVDETFENPAKGKAMVDFLDWALGPGQQEAKILNFAPLPEALAMKVRRKVASIKF
jgi:phosphate transport system substrate-binding protein